MKMPNLFLLPNGNAISAATVRSVQLAAKGVQCRDAQNRLVAWIPVSNEELGCKVRDLLISTVQKGLHAPQPDWSFLKNETDLQANQNLSISKKS